MKVVQRLNSAYRTLGPTGLVRAITRRVFKMQARSARACLPLLRGKAGIEIGGPSPIFKKGHLLPVYPIVSSLDNCNFGTITMWEGRLKEGLHFKYDAAHEPGFQFIREATDLHGIPDASYDFVLSCYMIEHTANPIQALFEWKRVMRGGGVLLLVAPHRDGFFDHRRPVTSLEHLIEDYRTGVDEADATHFEEVLSLHDLKRDPEVASHHAFQERTMRNMEYRGVHHHVFDTDLMAKVVAWVGFELLAVETVMPSIIVLARKPAPAR